MSLTIFGKKLENKTKPNLHFLTVSQELLERLHALADMWRDHYEELLNSSTNSHEKVDLLEHFKSISFRVGMQVGSLQIVKDLPNAKSSELDGLNGESLKYAHPLLCLLLSIGFTCMFKYCYMPQCMINSVIIPLIKNKCGDHTDKNNYRPIVLSSIISKVTLKTYFKMYLLIYLYYIFTLVILLYLLHICVLLLFILWRLNKIQSINKVFEHIIIERLEICLWTNDNQFGFKSGHSTDLCIYALTEFIESFKSHSTSVYVAFLDASKAFDKISHGTLFRKLIHRGVPLYLVMILCYWYQKQEMTVRWGACISDSFKVTNGVHQGGILSLQLFNISIDGLSDILNKFSIGGSIGGKRINICSMQMIFVLLVYLQQVSSNSCQFVINTVLCIL